MEVAHVKLAARGMRVSSTAAQMHALSQSGTIAAMPRMVPATDALPATTAQTDKHLMLALKESSQ